MARDNFKQAVKDDLESRAGSVCSNPDCGKPTRGPKRGDTGAVNIGVAAHITAASPGGPRYDPGLSPEERASAANGVWVCQNCSHFIDHDQYSAADLREWKLQRETAQAARVRGEAREGSSEPAVVNAPLIATVNQVGDNVIQTTAVPQVRFLQQHSTSRPAADGRVETILRFGNPDGHPVGRSTVKLHFSRVVESARVSVGVIPNDDGSVSGAVVGASAHGELDCAGRTFTAEVSGLGAGNCLDITVLTDGELGAFQREF